MIGQRMLLIPKPGLVIRDPGNRRKPLDPAGRVVVVDEFWSRRIADGDVEVRDPRAQSERAIARAAASSTPSETPRERAIAAHAASATNAPTTSEN